MEDAKNEAEANETEAATAPLSFDPMDPRIIDVFANEAYIAVGNSEVSIVFGALIPGTDGQMRPSCRVFMSQATFVGLMAVWMKRSDFITEVYGDNPMALSDMNSDRIRELFAKMIS